MSNNPNKIAPNAKHDNFFVFQADSHHELGKLLGNHFGNECQAFLARKKQSPLFHEKRRFAEILFPLHQQYFPQYIEELLGYASGASVDFLDLFTIGFEDELDFLGKEHCTSGVIRDGVLIAHNEDWDQEAADRISVIQKTIRDTTILELYYHHTLGGNAMSINSHGIVTLVNSLPASPSQLGISKNFLSHFLSESRNPTRDIDQVRSLPRLSSYSITLIDTGRKSLFNVEFEKDQMEVRQPHTPFFHTNHPLSAITTPPLSSESTSLPRYEFVRSHIRNTTTREKLEHVFSESRGKESDINNRDTIARVLVDTEGHTASIYLAREPEKGVVDYPLPF